LRPLDERGFEQARELVVRLSRFPIEEIQTSPYLRCVQTVEPLAAALGLEPILRDELTEERQAADGAALLRELAGRGAVVCGHGGLEAEVLSAPKWRKGAAWVLSPDLRLVEEL